MRDILNSYTSTELKKEISKYNKKVAIRGYSKMTKSELVNEMMKHQETFNYLKKKEKAPKPTPKPSPKKEEPKPTPAPKPAPKKESKPKVKISYKPSEFKPSKMAILGETILPNGKKVKNMDKEKLFNYDRKIYLKYYGKDTPYVNFLEAERRRNKKEEPEPKPKPAPKPAPKKDLQEFNYLVSGNPKSREMYGNLLNKIAKIEKKNESLIAKNRDFIDEKSEELFQRKLKSGRRYRGLALARRFEMENEPNLTRKLDLELTKDRALDPKFEQKNKSLLNKELERLNQLNKRINNEIEKLKKN